MKKLLSFGLLLLLAGCDRQVLLEKYDSVDDHIWRYNKQFEFKTKVEDTAENYDLFVNLRHNGKYLYRNIWVILTIEDPRGEKLKLKNNLPLASKEGKWKGRGLGDIWDHNFLVRKNFRFARPGDYTFRLKHYMREDSLPGIMDVGLKISKAK